MDLDKLASIDSHVPTESPNFSIVETVEELCNRDEEHNFGNIDVDECETPKLTLADMWDITRYTELYVGPTNLKKVFNAFLMYD